jgi:sortase A
MARLHIRKRYILTLLAAFVFIIFVILLLPYRHKAGPKPKMSAPTNVITHSSANPSEAPVTSSYVSTAIGNEPKYISLPSINAAGYIVKVGIDQYNQVAAPGNVNVAGWYVNSLKPGQAGLSIIDGHVDGKKGPGIFLKLAELVAGDLYEVDLANGTKLTYQVQRVSTLKVADVPTVLFAHDPEIASQLNLITCYGTFNYQSDQYDERSIVMSKLISNT